MRGWLGEFFGLNEDEEDDKLDVAKANKEAKDAMDFRGLRVGDRVHKHTGYKWPGEVVSCFRNRAGQPRIVVECVVPEVAGALHIYNPQQLARGHGNSGE